MKILFRCLQVNNILLALLFFYITTCIAPAPPPRLNPARPNKKGIQINKASCNERIYGEDVIYNVTHEGFRYITHLKKYGSITRTRRYYVKVVEDMPTQGPFYYYQIYSRERFEDNHRDFVVFNMKGELAKVVTGIRKTPASPWKFKDCTISLR